MQIFFGLPRGVGTTPIVSVNVRVQSFLLSVRPPGGANPERGEHADCQRKRTCAVVSPQRAGRDHGPSTGDQRETTNGRPIKRN